ncbi:hypothetical protein MOMUL_19400 [Moorella mulderi DSM 14980]|uniref:Uncharacterized protein n=1 Tax=Moorella mulderi DSM 14980 TaxID=1122241 RepID=A0A151AWK7_9FIRM|nr:hypothetical protein MOMUL_19400 [Moorella mulderi DSM 14980]
MQAAIWKHIEDGNLEGVLTVLNEAEKTHPQRRQAVARAKRYIENQWDGIESQKRYREELLGCSDPKPVVEYLRISKSRMRKNWKP